MNVAVTGSHGYIGSVLCKTLTEAGHDVFACDNKKFLGGDFRYFKTIVNQSFDCDYYVDMIIYHNIQTIFHLAASSLLGPSVTDPLLYYTNNTGRTAAFVKKLADRGWKGHIIFSSTAAVYGNKPTPCKETDGTYPINHYGHSKRMCEKILNSAHVYGIRTTTFRYFNVAGAYEDIGQDAGEPHIVTRICNAAHSGHPLIVFGSDYSTRDGTCVRDYLHVRDVCNAQVHAMDIGCDVYQTFNLGTKEGTTVFEIIKAFVEVNKVHVPYNVGGKREGDPAVLIADPQSFIDTGFTYKHSSIEDITSSAWRKFNGI